MLGELPAAALPPRSTVEELAALQAMENLLQCHAREVAFPAGEAHVGADGALEIALPRTGRSVRAPLARISAVRGFELAARPLLDGAPALPLELARALIEEIAAREGAPAHPELLGLVADSAAVAARLRALRGSARPAPGFLGAEGALMCGHPFHPSPKARVGFDPADLERYSPELAAPFRLHGFAARASLVAAESLESRPAEALVREALGAAVDVPGGFVLLPAHPWQARRARESGALDALLRAGDVLDLGPVGDPCFATSSVRTVLRPGAPWVLKTSLSVRITNCLRRNAVPELRCAVQVTRWMREERPRLAARFPAFAALEEVAWLALSPPDVDPAERARLGELFGVLLRDAAPIHAARPEDEPVVLAALFGDRDEGRARLAALLPPPRREAWFAAYLDALVAPALWLFFEAGLMFEPHLQNVLVAGFDGASPRVLLRDFDNGKCVSGLFDPARLEALAPELRGELLYDAETAWERFVYCLFVNNLAEVAAMLADGDAAAEARLWAAARAGLEGYLARFGSARSRGPVAALLARSSLPAKANLMTRVFKRSDRTAAFVPVPNPLRAG
jgi:siderophore synthetase component